MSDCVYVLFLRFVLKWVGLSLYFLLVLFVPLFFPFIWMIYPERLAKLSMDQHGEVVHGSTCLDSQDTGS